MDMICNRCGKHIDVHGGYFRTVRGPHHSTCPKPDLSAQSFDSNESLFVQIPCYEVWMKKDGSELVMLGNVLTIKDHDCDQMGCGQCHVVARVKTVPTEE